MNKKLEYVNLSYLKEISGGDINFQKELINIFLSQIPVFIKNMHDFFNSNRYKDLAKEAHTAKSSVLIFMMEDTGKTLKEIQLLAENNHIDKIPPLISRVENTLNHASKELTQYKQNL